MEKEKIDIIQLFKLEKEKKGYLNVAAPMVRYSKLEFRKLLRKYGADLCFTPMIVAKSFHESPEARKVEFKSDLDDKPLIAQLASCNSYDLCKSSELLFPYVDGIDINCGCPQKWAISYGYGCALLKQPQIIYDMIKSMRRIQPTNEFSFSIKMRLLHNKDNKYTIDLCRQFESCGITFLTIHGRTPWQKTSESINIEAISDIKKSLRIPIIANGDIRKLNDLIEMHKLINCDGYMVARGLLSNPTLFMNTDRTTLDCIQDWLNLTYTANENITFQCLHHHLTFMMEKLMKRKQRIIFNNFNKKEQIYDFIYNEFNIIPKLEKNYNLLDIDFYNDDSKGLKGTSDGNAGEGGERGGKFYTSFKENILNNYNNDNDDCDSLDFMGTTIFDV